MQLTKDDYSLLLMLMGFGSRSGDVTKAGKRFEGPETTLVSNIGLWMGWIKPLLTHQANPSAKNRLECSHPHRLLKFQQ